MTEPSIAERVAAGAAWLDTNRPGWLDRIDLITLDLSDHKCCVLGQEYGDYHYAPLGYDDERAALAFTLHWTYDADSRGFDELTEAWRSYVLDHTKPRDP